MKKLFFIGAIVLSSMLSADYVLEYNMDGEIQRFMYHDASKAKLVTPSDDSSAVYKIGDKTYIVSGSGKNKKIVDMDEMRAMVNSFGYDPSAYNQEETFKPKIKKTSKRVTVAGIKGYEWIVSVDDNGEESEKVVVTNDKRVVKTVRAMKNLFTSMSGINTENNDLFEIEKGYVIIKANGLVLSSFKEKNIDKSEYTLPTDAQKQKMPKYDQKKMEALQKHLEEIAKEVEKEVEKAKAEAESKAKKDTKKQDNASQEDLDTQKAVNLLKSFF